MGCTSSSSQTPSFPSGTAEFTRSPTPNGSGSLQTPSQNFLNYYQRKSVSSQYIDPDIMNLSNSNSEMELQKLQNEQNEQKQQKLKNEQIKKVFENIYSENIVYLKTIDITDQTIWNAKMSVESMKKYDIRLQGLPPTPLLFAIDCFVNEKRSQKNIISIIEHFIQFTNFDVQYVNLLGHNLVQEMDNYIELLDMYMKNKLHIVEHNKQAIVNQRNYVQFAMWKIDILEHIKIMLTAKMQTPSFPSTPSATLTI